METSPLNRSDSNSIRSSMSSFSSGSNCSSSPDHTAHNSSQNNCNSSRKTGHHRKHGSKAKFKLIVEGDIQVCRLNHTRTIISKIMNSKYLRRWECHRLILGETDIVSSTVCIQFRLLYLHQSLSVCKPSFCVVMEYVPYRFVRFQMQWMMVVPLSLS